MGKLIEQLAPEYGFEVALKLDEFNNANDEGITPETSRTSMSPSSSRCPQPWSATSNGSRRLASTRWSAPRAGRRTSTACAKPSRSSGIGLVWSPNFSIGVNVFFRLVAEAARLLADEPEYGAWAWEIHHDTKKDAPSGTLLKLVDEMKKAGYTRNIDVSSNRAGAIPARTRSASIRGGHHHAAPHRPQPRRLRPRRAEGGPMDRRTKGLVRVRRNVCSDRDVTERRWYMFTGCGTALVTPFQS